MLVGRHPKPAERLAKRLPAAAVMGADVSTAGGIDHATTQIEGAVDHLGALVNSAGVMIPNRHTTSEDIELSFAVHHLVPYSMTSRLLPLLQASSGRVINTNSEGHRAPLFGGGPVRIDLDDLNMEGGCNPYLAYRATKLANLLFNYELQRRHPELSVVAVHPADPSGGGAPTLLG